MADDAAYVFICFSSVDETTARDVVTHLEHSGQRCWISLRDVPPGSNYQESIIAALEGAKALVFLFSQNSAASGEIKKELSVAGSLNMPVIPLRLSPIMPTGALRYELATRQWIDLFVERELGFRRLTEAVSNVRHHALQAEDEVRPANLLGLPGEVISAAEPGAPGRRNDPPKATLYESSSEDVEAIRGLLAHHVGPIAKIIIQKALLAASTPDDFCERLAGYVTSPSDRILFLKAARSRLRGKG